MNVHGTPLIKQYSYHEEGPVTANSSPNSKKSSSCIHRTESYCTITSSTNTLSYIDTIKKQCIELEDPHTRLKNSRDLVHAPIAPLILKFIRDFFLNAIKKTPHQEKIDFETFEKTTLAYKFVIIKLTLSECLKKTVHDYNNASFFSQFLSESCTALGTTHAEQLHRLLHDKIEDSEWPHYIAKNNEINDLLRTAPELLPQLHDILLLQTLSKACDSHPSQLHYWMTKLGYCFSKRADSDCIIGQEDSLQLLKKGTPLFHLLSSPKQDQDLDGKTGRSKINSHISLDYFVSFFANKLKDSNVVSEQINTCPLKAPLTHQSLTSACLIFYLISFNQELQNRPHSTSLFWALDKIDTLTEYLDYYEVKKPLLVTLKCAVQSFLEIKLSKGCLLRHYSAAESRYRGLQKGSFEQCFSEEAKSDRQATQLIERLIQNQFLIESPMSSPENPEYSDLSYLFSPSLIKEFTTKRYKNHIVRAQISQVIQTVLDTINCDLELTADDFKSAYMDALESNNHTGLQREKPDLLFESFKSFLIKHRCAYSGYKKISEPFDLDLLQPFETSRWICDIRDTLEKSKAQGHIPIDTHIQTVLKTLYHSKNKIHPYAFQDAFTKNCQQSSEKLCSHLSEYYLQETLFLSSNNEKLLSIQELLTPHYSPSEITAILNLFRG